MQTQKIAVVTGASSGIGESFAHEVARDGYTPVLVARRNQELQRVAETIAACLGCSPVVVPIDLSERNAGFELEAELNSRDIVPDLLINNAGFGLMGPATSLSISEQLAMINLNVRTLTALSLRYGSVMRSRGSGGIINVSSVGGALPGPNMAVYYATKSYILSFTEALSAELRPFGVRVTAVVPGVTRTGFHRRAGMEDSLLMRSAVPMTAEEVARIGYTGHLSGRRVVVAGGFNKFAMFCTRFVPHAVLLPVTARLHT